MAEGWLFRLRTSLGSQYSAPAWPGVREDEVSPGALRGLRPAARERGAEAEPVPDPLPGEREA